MCDVAFGLFTLVWIVSRLVVLPGWIFHSTLVHAPQSMDLFPAYYLFNALLSVLLVLHVVWTFFIVKIFYNALQGDFVRVFVRYFIELGLLCTSSG